MSLFQVTYLNFNFLILINTLMQLFPNLFHSDQKQKLTAAVNLVKKP